MSDEFTEVTNESWFSRIGSAFKGVLVGLVLFVVAFPLLFWNEGRAVQTAQSLAEGAKAVVNVKADKVDPANDGKFVHFSGEATTSETLTDEFFGVSVNAIRLDRDVEMYQWVEHTETEKRKKLGGGTETTTTYRYEKEWSSELNRSSDFKKPDGHTNPSQMPVMAMEWQAENVAVGAFHLPEELVDRIVDPVPVSVDPSKLPPVMKDQVVDRDGGYYRPASAPPMPSAASLTAATDDSATEDGGSTDSGGEDGGAGEEGTEGDEDESADEEKPDDDEEPASGTNGTATDASAADAADAGDEPADDAGGSSSPDAGTDDSDSDAAPTEGASGDETTTDDPAPSMSDEPRVGDVRITFAQTKQQPVSILAQQAGDTLTQYQTKAGDALMRLELGTKSAEVMFANANAENNMMTWILRLVGTLLMFFGLTMIFRPLSVLADVVPFIGSIVGAGTGLIAALIALCLSFMTISVAWLFYRPLIGVPLLVGGLALGFWAITLLNRQSTAAPPAE